MREPCKWSEFSEEEKAVAIEKARGIMAGGETRWHTVARLCGLRDGIGLRTNMDPGWRKRRAEAQRTRDVSRLRADLDKDMPTRIDPADVAARLAEIPPDTRTLTGFLFGDPLPGRSALARRQA